MQIEVKNKNWTQALSFSDALGSLIVPPVKIAVVGSGGKTSIIMSLAEEQRALNRKVLVLTTTHMYKPKKYGVFSGLAGDVADALEKDGIAVTGEITDNGKIAWQGDLIYTELSALADVVLIEADGSKQLPVKFPNEHEPVIPSDTDIILVVSGLCALGHRGIDACHRWELAKPVLNICDDEAFLEEEQLRVLMEKGFLLPLKEKFPQIPVIPIFNQADDAKLKNIGKLIIDALEPEIGIVSSFDTQNQ